MAFFYVGGSFKIKAGGDPPAESNIVRRLFAFVFQIFNLR